MSTNNNLECKEEECSNCNCNHEFDDRDIILAKLNDAIEYLHHKSMNGRILDEKNEKVRISWFKALAYCCNVYNSIKKDADLEDLQRQVQELSDEIKRMER